MYPIPILKVGSRAFLPSYITEKNKRPLYIYYRKTIIFPLYYIVLHKFPNKCHCIVSKKCSIVYAKVILVIVALIIYTKDNISVSRIIRGLTKWYFLGKNGY